VAALAALAIVVAAEWDLTQDSQVLWQQWLKLHPHVLRLSPEKLKQRFQVFKANLAKILEDNVVDPEELQSLGPHAHVTVEEFYKWRTGRTNPGRQTRSAKRAVVDISALPKSVDWRKKGRVSSIKDQGQCGSCWTFAAVTALETAWAVKKHRKPVAGSQQQILDCDLVSSGCKGGTGEQGINLAARAGGLKSASSYPYKGRAGSCRKFSGKVAAKTKGAYSIAPGDYNSMMSYVATRGALSVGIHANEKWMHYRKGIISSSSKCSPVAKIANHEVNIVGYGKKNGVPIWIIRNSWGKTWGIKGYALLKRGAKFNSCGVHNWAAGSNV